MSLAVSLAQDVANHINTTRYLWPNVTPGGVHDDVPHLMTVYTTAKAAVIPEVKRSTLNSVRVLVCPQEQAQSEDQAGSDRCSRRWVYSLDIAVMRNLGTQNTDWEQPATLDEITRLMSFSEALVDFIDQEKTIGTATLVDLEFLSYSRERLEGGIYICSIQPTYRYHG
jgi:hypothetical protein